jgi:hypothetical protein
VAALDVQRTLLQATKGLRVLCLARLKEAQEEETKLESALEAAPLRVSSGPHPVDKNKTKVSFHDAD